MTLNLHPLLPLADAVTGTGERAYLMDDDVITVDHADRTLFVGDVHLVMDDVSDAPFEAVVVSQVDAGVLLFSFPLAYLPSQLRRLGRVTGREALSAWAPLVKTA